MQHPSRQAGFTIIELMVVLVVAAIILAFAVPSFQGIINSNRVTTAVNEISTSIATARTEAIKANSTSQLKAKGGVWSNGYDVIVDVNRDSIYEDSATEVMRTIGPIDNRITTFLVNSATTTLTFNSLGGLDGSLGETFRVYSPKAFGRHLTINTAGSTSVCVRNIVNPSDLTICP
jgi:type IV fimbrial biogenesis protein FimT